MEVNSTAPSPTLPLRHPHTRLQATTIPAQITPQISSSKQR
jgi:hypothetical protein